MSNVGFATLQIIPSMRGLEAQLQGQLSSVGPLGEKAGGAAGQGFANRFAGVAGGVVRSVGGALVDGMRAAAVTAGTGTAAVLGVSLFKGFQRLTTIQDATAALTVSLGDATKAGKLLGGVLDVVKGTPFALDQFAAAAQQMAGFGISADKIPAILTAIGDASATQGKRAGEFAGRLTDVFGQMAAKGQVSLDDVWRISETGVNALTILANHFHLSTNAMKDLISSGAVPAGEAMDALTKGIEQGSKGVAGTTVALKGTMEALGNTVSGSLSNMKTAFARFGETLLKPFSKDMVTAFTAVGGVLDNLGKALGPVLAKFANSEGFRTFVTWLETLPKKVGPAVDRLRELGPALGPIAGAIGAIAAKAGPLGALLPNINPLVAAFAGLAATSPELRESLKGVFETIKPVIDVLGKQLAEAVRQLIPALLPVINMLGPTLQPIIAALGPLLGSLVPPLAQVLAAAAPLLNVFGQLIATLAPILGMVAQLAGVLIAALLPAITPLVAALAVVVAQIGTALQPVIAQIIPIIQQNADVFARFVQALVPLIPALGQLLIALLPILPPLIQLLTLQVRLAAALLPVITFVAQLASFLIEKLALAITLIVSGIKDSLIPYFLKGLDVIKSMLPAIGEFLVGVIKFFADLPTKIVEAIGDLARKLYDVGYHAIQGFIDGIRSQKGGVIGAIKSVVGSAIPGAQFILDSHSPSRVFFGLGQDTIQGYLLGLRSMQDRIGDEMAMLAASAPQIALSPVSLPPIDAIGTDGAAAASDIVIENRLSVDSRELNSATAATRVRADRRYRRARS